VTFDRRKAIGGAMALAVIAAAATGCGSSSSSSSGSAGSKTMGISLPYVTNDFFVALNAQTRAEAKKDGWKLLASTDAKQKVDQQVTDVTNLIDQGATGLVLDPGDSSGIVPALNYAAKQGVPVVLVDVGATGGKAYMTVTTNNAKAAETACGQLVKSLTAQNVTAGTVLELQGDLASDAGRQRSDGFESCMKQKAPNIKIVAKPTKWQAAAAADATQTVLSQQKIDGIYLASDCAMQAAVQAALKQAGKTATVGAPGHVVLGAIDGCPPSLAAIKAGTMDFTVEQPIVKYGQRVVHWLDQAKKNAQPKVGPDGFGGQIVTAPTGLLDYVPATLVTKVNVDSPELWGNTIK
jgi:ribose transport system substrate-binding protein